MGGKYYCTSWYSLALSLFVGSITAMYTLHPKRRKDQSTKWRRETYLHEVKINFTALNVYLAVNKHKVTFSIVLLHISYSTALVA